MPLKQKYLLVAAVLAVESGKAHTVDSWLEYHRILCAKQRIIAVRTNDEKDMLDGLEQLDLVRITPAPRSPARRLAHINVNVTRDDLEHAFAEEDTVMAILASVPPPRPPRFSSQNDASDL